MTSETVSAFETYPLEWMDQVVEGQNPFAHLPENKIQDIYALAFLLYQNQQYQESSNFFRLLVVACPSEKKFWKSLGASLQMQKDYEEAISCYMSCFQLSDQDHLDPYLFVQTADCYFALQQVEAALKALEVAHLYATETRETRVLNHVALMRQLWKTS